MARATICFTFATGESIMCETECDEDYPDAIREVGVNTRRLYRETMQDQREAEAQDAEEQP